MRFPSGCAVDVTGTTRRPESAVESTNSPCTLVDRLAFNETGHRSILTHQKNARDFVLRERCQPIPLPAVD